MKLYGSDLSVFVQKIRFVLHHLELEYDYIRVSIPDGETRTKEFLAKNPVGKVPVLEDGDFVVFESNAIAKYLARKTGSDIYPQTLKEQAIVDQWIDFATYHVGGAMMKLLFNIVIAPKRNLAIDENSLKDGWTFLKRFLPVCDGQLSKKAFLASDALSLADFTLLAALEPVEAVGADLSECKALVAWRNKLKSQPFYQKTYSSYLDVLK